jgi:uncharacterized protein involved in exopolysaccharide biosynthesis
MSDRDLLVDLGDPARWRAAAGLVWRGLVQYRWSVLLLAVVFGAVGVGAAKVTPRMYSAETRLLVRTNPVMPALAHPKRAVPVMENLTQSAGELVHNRQSIVTMIERFDLLARWDRDRPPALRLKDWVMASISGPVNDEARMEALIEVVARRVTVTVEDQTIRVRAAWTDPKTTLDLANGALDAFLAGRRRIDVDAIAETYTILEQSAEAMRVDLEQRVSAAELAARVASSVRPSAPVVDRAVPAVRPDPLAAPRTRVLDARARVTTLAEQHAAQRRTLEASLADLLTRATDRHPDVVTLRRQVAASAEEPEALRTARVEASEAWRAFVAGGGSEIDLAGPAVVVPVAAVRSDAGVNVTRILEEDGATLYSRSLLKSSIAAYQDLLERLGNTRLELETAKAAFDFKYTVIVPARLPKKADSPNGLVLMVAAMVAGVGLGVSRAIFLSWRAQA